MDPELARAITSRQRSGESDSNLRVPPGWVASPIPHHNQTTNYNHYLNRGLLLLGWCLLAICSVIAAALNW